LKSSELQNKQTNLGWRSCEDVWWCCYYSYCRWSQFLVARMHFYLVIPKIKSNQIKVQSEWNHVNAAVLVKSIVGYYFPSHCDPPKSNHPII